MPQAAWKILGFVRRGNPGVLKSGELVSAEHQLATFLKIGEIFPPTNLKIFWGFVMIVAKGFS